MTSQALREARRYEEAAEKLLDPKERPAFHLPTRVGWMNDPNGFSFYKGKYHMFYQYYPYDSNWGPMHWGHAVSSDLLHWENLPAALAPDMDYDFGGCFSGSAAELADGRQLLMYTGVVKQAQPNGTFREFQSQCIATGDGVDYVKYDGNPVLPSTELPEGFSRHDFRDPKIWQKADGTWLCVAGSRPADGSGQILLFSSADGFHWKYEKVLIENKNRFGKMWECPDFFPLDGKQVLLTSPQDMLPQGFEYHNGNGTLCLIGDYDEDSYTFTEQHDQAVDYGIDFYAPQTVLAPDGRRIMIGWLQNWDTLTLRNHGQTWFGQMSLPRELSIKNGRLYQWPVRELERLRRNPVTHQNILVQDTDGLKLNGVCGRMVDLELEIRPEDGAPLYQKFAVRFAQNKDFQTSLSFRPHESVLKIDRKFSGSRRAIIHQRRSRVNSTNGCLRLRLVLDRCSAEVFVNGGEQAMSATLFTYQAAQGISFFADGAVRINVTKYDIIM